jgi:hypothetical protein
MSEEKITRRGAMGKVLKIIALSAGISVSELTLILSAKAGTVKSSEFIKVKNIARSKLKMLKVKLSGYNKGVFQSEFGRITPLKPVRQMRIPDLGKGMKGMGCAVHLFGGMGGGNAATTCPSLSLCISNADSSCPSLSFCTENVCSDQDCGGDQSGKCTVNDCNNQDCGTLWGCKDNECTDQDCPDLTVCSGNKSNIAGLVDLLSRFSTNSYVQDLMNHFHITNTRQLAKQVNSMIMQKRAITPAQLRQ